MNTYLCSTKPKILASAAAVLWLLAEPQSFAQEKPRAYLLAFELSQIDNELGVAFKDALNNVRSELAKQWINTPQTLDSQIDPTSLSINQGRAAKKILSGPSAVDHSDDLVIEPLIAAMADHLFFQVQIISLQKGQLLAASHLGLSRTELKNWQQQKILAPQLTKNFQQLNTELQQQIVAAPASPQHTLRIGLALDRDSTRHDSLSFLALNGLVAESLIAQQNMTVFQSGREGLQFLRNIRRINTKLTRATRTLNVDWQLPLRSSKNPHLQLPVSFPYALSLSESVFGTRALELASQKAALSYDAAQKKFRLDWGSAPQALLAQEKSMLQSNDAPEIVKIDRAWVYLDRGRAFGLKLDDRLVVSDQPEQIKGHVVGFFGPALGLKAQNGMPVHEGAIVFIRKGQQLTEVGQNLEFDTKEYPTSWPPGSVSQ